MPSDVHLLLISGSVRTGSSNEAALRTVAELAGDGVDTTRYEGLAELPHFNPDLDVDPLPPAVVALRTAIERADALLFCTPEYAGSLPGSFKNLLDWTVGGIETIDKPSCWINISSSGTAAAGAHDALGTVLRYTGAAVVDAACAHIPVRRDQIGEGGVVDDPDLRREIAAAVAALVATVRAARGG